MPNPGNRWPKKFRGAVSLTYDDALPNHLERVAPQLEQYHLRGTFYTPLMGHLMQDPLAWRKLAGRGHELGNHTVFHPCWPVGGRHAQRLPEEFNLEHYSAERWVEEVSTANQALFLVDGKSERTFGNTCFGNYLGPQDCPVCLEPLIAQHFSAARGEDTGKPVNLARLNFQNLGTIWADRRSFGDFVPELEELLENGGWLIYTMHGVGAGSHAHWIDAAEHERVLAFLHDAAARIWTAPVIEVAQYLKKHSFQ